MTILKALSSIDEPEGIMDIGIIGAGHIGGSLTRRLAGLGHAVRVSNSRAPETLADLAGETGATAVWAHEAAADTDLVIVSIPQKNVVDLAAGIVAGAKPGAPVIETNNYYPRERDGLIAAIEAGTPDSVWVSEQLGGCGLQGVQRDLLEALAGGWAPARQRRSHRVAGRR
jgi:predicted dinucleotide-binding enzyme